MTFAASLLYKNFVGRMTKTEDKYWVDTDSFVHSSIPKKSDTTHGNKGTRFPYVHAPYAQNPHNPSLSRFEIFPHAQTYCSEPITSLSNTMFRHLWYMHHWFQYAYRATKSSFSFKRMYFRKTRSRSS